mgnify:FL=1
MEGQKTKDFLEASLLPAILELTKTVSSMTVAQERDHQKVELALQNDRKETQTMEQSIGVLVKTISKLSKPVADLVLAVNQSNQLQQKQNQLLQELQDNITEQNARMSVLNQGLATQTEDPGIQAMYDQLNRIGKS